jgi:hypothetical protein
MVTTFATIAVLGVLSFFSHATPPSTLVVAFASLVVFAASAGRRALLVSEGCRRRDAERTLVIAMLVSSSVVLFSLATAIGRAGRPDLVVALPFVLALLGSVVHDAKDLGPGGRVHTGRLVPVCGLLVMLAFWLVNTWLGDGRPYDAGLHTAAIELDP